MYIWMGEFFHVIIDCFIIFFSTSNLIPEQVCVVGNTRDDFQALFTLHLCLDV